MHGSAVRNESHAGFAARDQHRLRAERIAQGGGRRRDFLFRSRGSVRRIGQFLPVRRDQRRAAIDAVVAALRIDDHRLAGLARGGNHRADDARRQRALRIIGQHHCADARQRGNRVRDDRVFAHLRDRRCEFPIGAQQVRRMVLGDEAHLACCLPRGIEHQARIDQRIGGERLRERAARVVLADDPDENAVRPERGQIARDIAGAADHQFAALAGDHRRRRLRRNARDLAIDEFVQHQIADAEHGLGGKIGKMLIEIEHALAIPVRRVEIPGDVARYGCRSGVNCRIIAGPAQVLDVGLREILILAADRFRHVDVFDVGGAAERRRTSR